MSLIANIGTVAADFVLHPFSDTELTRPSSKVRMVVLEKDFAAPTITKSSPTSRPNKIYSIHGAGDDLIPVPEEAADAPPPAPPKPGMPMHKVALWAFIVLAFGCLIADVALAFTTNEPYTGAQNNAFKTLDWGIKTGFGAIAGVLTGKASDLPNA